MTTVVVSIDPGTKNVGVCVSVDSEVSEGATVESTTSERWPLDDLVSIVAMSEVAVDLALVMRDEALVGLPNGTPVVYAVETVRGPSRFSAAQAKVAQSRQVTESVIGLGISYGAVMAAFDGHGIPNIVQVRPDKFDHRPTNPDLLSGRIPPEWLMRSPGRHRKGAERQHQRSAYWLGQQALRQVGAARPAQPLLGTQTRTPVTSLPTAARIVPKQAKVPVRKAVEQRSTKAAPTASADAGRAYVNALVAVIRASSPTTHEQVVAAAEAALASVPAVAGVPALSAVDLAMYAVTSAGVARPLWALRPALHKAMTTAAQALTQRRNTMTGAFPSV